MERLEELREKIDGIDDEIVALYRSRMEVCKDIALFKSSKGLPVLNTVRESQVLSRVMKGMPDELSVFVRQLFSTILETSKAYQDRLFDVRSGIREEIEAKLRQGGKPFPLSATVVCEGEPGAFSSLASDRLFPNAAQIFVQDSEGVFNTLEKGRSCFGVLPIENGLTGSINAVYDLMRRHHFHIVRAIRFPVKHYLLASVGVELESIAQVSSDPHALGQGSELKKPLVDTSVAACENKAAAAKTPSEIKRIDAACIASNECASVYPHSILKESVQDNNLSNTRFIAISKEFDIYESARKISMVIDLRHEPGSLSRLLNKFSAMNLNLTKLESRPIASSPFEFSFYLDFEADISDEGVLNLLSEIEKSSNRFTFLGSYDEVQ